jgi:hypothetical protein
MASDPLRILIVLVLAAGGGPLYAPPAAGQDLGRLFLTPQERQDLDRKRAANISDEVPQVESRVTVNGQVQRSSGRTTTWINGVPQDDAYRGSPVDRVPVESGESSVRVKVGQTLDRSSGTVSDPLAGGEIRVNRGAQR